ncbi:MAG TPA: hypothetical protein VJY62_14435 [Bacteroidia bacterium]|nr:hypothetical protein [Bacteroidia bacterium]
MEKFHASIKIRLENLGRGYEMLVSKVFDFNKEAGKFFADLKKQVELCQEQNNPAAGIGKGRKIITSKAGRAHD